MYKSCECIKGAPVERERAKAELFADSICLKIEFV